MSYRNTITPDRLRGRMNATIRSLQLGLDRRLGTLGGWVAATWGNRVAIAVGIAGLAGAATLLTLSPYRRAEFPTDAPER